jgi:hypothetical protein
VKVVEAQTGLRDAIEGRGWDQSAEGTGSAKACVSSVMISKTLAASFGAVTALGLGITCLTADYTVEWRIRNGKYLRTAAGLSAGWSCARSFAGSHPEVRVQTNTALAETAVRARAIFFGIPESL